MASRSMILIPGKSRYRDDNVSATPSIDATVTAAEDFGAIDIATSCPLAGEGGAKPPSSAGTIATLAGPGR
jgi:hypothetical protein